MLLEMQDPAVPLIVETCASPALSSLPHGATVGNGPCHYGHETTCGQQADGTATWHWHARANTSLCVPPGVVLCTTCWRRVSRGRQPMYANKRRRRASSVEFAASGPPGVAKVVSDVAASHDHSLARASDVLVPLSNAVGETCPGSSHDPLLVDSRRFRIPASDVSVNGSIVPTSDSSHRSSAGGCMSIQTRRTLALSPSCRGAMPASSHVTASLSVSGSAAASCGNTHGSTVVFAAVSDLQTCALQPSVDASPFSLTHGRPPECL